MSLARRQAVNIIRLAALASLSVLVAGAQDKPAPAATPPPDNKPAEYVGSQTCQACHEDIYNGILKSPHQRVEADKHRGWEGRVCESCHGPGSKHADSTSPADIRQPAKLKPAETDRICVSCHLNQPDHIGRTRSSHAKNQVSCVACHFVHKERLVARKQTEINEQCAGCHTSVWASFQRPYKHRLPEGAMSCVDCHDPHGSVLAAPMQRAIHANEPSCFQCHGDLRGPFPYEHAPMRVEGCMACHQPHGSANPRMLTRQSVQYVCLECHSNLPAPTPSPNGTLGGTPPAFHDLRSPRFQNCNICHQKIHGSYVDRGLLK